MTVRSAFARPTTPLSSIIASFDVGTAVEDPENSRSGARKVREDNASGQQTAQLIPRKQKQVVADYPDFDVELPESGKVLSGATNIHLIVIDTDGATWVASAGKEIHDPPEIRRLYTETEIAAMLSLQGVEPVPRIRPAPTSKNYFLIEYMQGSPASFPMRLEGLDQHQQRALFRDFASHYISLERPQFDKIGSLYREADA